MEDLFAKKKETAPILDLSKAKVTCKEEFRKLLEKVPDFKIKSEKVLPESIKIKDNKKKFKFKSGRKDLKTIKEKFHFSNPLPREMQELKISELAAVPIDWKMLTTLRPKTKLDENYFSRLVELKKLENKARSMEKRHFAIDPQIRKIKNRAGIVEMRVVNCIECGQDFCNGKECNALTYDLCARQSIQPKFTETTPAKIKNEKLRKRKRKKIKSKKIK